MADQKAVARLGDPTGYDPPRKQWHGGTLIGGSRTVFADGKNVVTVGGVHKCGIGKHNFEIKGGYEDGNFVPGLGGIKVMANFVASGSDTVFADGKAVSRVDDLCGCSAMIAEGSPTTYAA